MRTRWGLDEIGMAILIAIGIAGLGAYLFFITAYVIAPMLRWAVAG